LNAIRQTATYQEKLLGIQQQWQQEGRPLVNQYMDVEALTQTMNDPQDEQAQGFINTLSQRTFKTALFIAAMPNNIINDLNGVPGGVTEVHLDYVPRTYITHVLLPLSPNELPPKEKIKIKHVQVKFVKSKISPIDFAVRGGTVVGARAKCPNYEDAVIPILAELLDTKPNCRYFIHISRT